MSKLNEAKELGLVLTHDAGTTAADLCKNDPDRAAKLADFIRMNLPQLVAEISTQAPC